MKIAKITAQEIIASGGLPTIEASVYLESGGVGVASVPYGASTGSLEATVLVDGDQRRFGGQGMLKAVKNVETEIADILLGKEVANQEEIDQLLIDADGTDNKSRLGGNAILAVSMACARAGALATGLPLYRYLAEIYDLPRPRALPKPMAVCIEGGKHADRSTDFQEYCLTGIGSTTVFESLRAVLESYHQLKQILHQHSYSTNVGNEGAFAPSGVQTNQQPLEMLTQAITQAGYQPGKDLSISIDAAASEFFKDGKYHLQLEKQSYTSEELISYYQSWIDKYPLVSLEDMFAENDWLSWQAFQPIVKHHQIIQIGDDLTVTNPSIIKKAIQQQAISGVIIKLNQIGTVSETIAACKIGKEHNLMLVPSHRGGGETNDAFMIDLAVAVGASWVKVGPTRGERVSKYNRLLAIERELLL